MMIVLFLFVIDNRRSFVHPGKNHQPYVLIANINVDNIFPLPNRNLCVCINSIFLAVGGRRRQRSYMKCRGLQQAYVVTLRTFILFDRDIPSHQPTWPADLSNWHYGTTTTTMTWSFQNIQLLARHASVTYHSL